MRNVRYETEEADISGRFGRGGFIAHAEKRTYQNSAEARILHNLLTPLGFRPSSLCLLCLKANMVTASKRRQIPSIGNIARMVLAPHDGHK